MSPADPTERALRGSAPRSDSAAAAERFAERAEAEGLLDVAYARADTPHGPLLVAATERGVIRAALPGFTEEDVLEELAAEVSPRIIEHRRRLDPALREIEAYFAGELRRFGVPLDRRLMRGWQIDVLRVTSQIPFGGTLSYGEVAAEAGRPRAYRAAGTALGRNPIPLIVPCHRVLKSGGQIGNYGGGPDLKRALLTLEGALAE